MNFNCRLKCKVCSGLVDCRIGMSNRDVQELRFACPTCGEPIEVAVSLEGEFSIKGAKQQEPRDEFGTQHPFVDLHLDFLVQFGPYVMGRTPFLRAVGRVGHENYQLHNHRLNALNEFYKLQDDVERVLRLYNKNNDLFSRLCKSRFGIEVESQNLQDINSALYKVLSLVFFPFSIPSDNAESVELYLKTIRQLTHDDKVAFDAFITQIIETSFLTNLQHDCLEIYPKILKAEVPLRPALFLDFEEDPGQLISSRVSSANLRDFTNLYNDISEILSRGLVLVAALNNLKHRGDSDCFDSSKPNSPRDLDAYADVPFGSKLSHLDDCWHEIEEGRINNRLRNAIAHYKIEYDDRTQIISYFPKREGLAQEESVQLYFLEFMRALLVSYREMHRLHQLVKCLLNYRFFLHEQGVKVTAVASSADQLKCSTQ